MPTAKTSVEIDEETPSATYAALDTAAHREVEHGATRLEAIVRLGEMADQGDFDESLGNKRAYR